jgi:hypothetical protein
MRRHDQCIDRAGSQLGHGRIAIGSAGDLPLVAPGMDEFSQLGRQGGLVPYKQNMQNISPAAAQHGSRQPHDFKPKQGAACRCSPPVL